MLLRRILKVYVFIIIIMSTVMGLLVYNIINSTIKSEIIKSNKLVIDNGLKYFTNSIEDIKSLALDISIDGDVQNALRNFSLNSALSENIGDVIKNNKYVTCSLNKYGVKVGIFPIDKQQNVYYYNETYNKYIPINKDKNIDWLEKTIEKNGSFLMQTVDIDNNSVIRLSRVIYDTGSLDKAVGIMAVDLNQEGISSLLYDFRLEGNVAPYLIDSNGKVIFPYFISRNIISEFLQKTTKDVNVTNESNIIISRNIMGTDWKLVGIVSQNELLIKSNQVKYEFLITIIISILLVILISYFFSYRITKPIERLINQMKDIGTKEPEVLEKLEELEPRPFYKGEILVLYNSYNNMVISINNLVQKAYIAEIKKKDAELLALQAQINPHFLYNTLDAVNWMALKYNAMDIRHMISSLAAMMRYSLNGGKNFMSVKNEISQVKNYLEIQRVRYPNLFETEFIIDNKILDYVIIKLLLQPLVENAIVHGFNGKVKHGNLSIKGFEKEGNLVFEVINDGEKIDTEKVNRLLKSSAHEKSLSYGMKSVNNRLIHQYGENYGLSFKYEDGCTKFIIRIPLDKLEEEEKI